jgi:hypothetical protein
LLHFKALWLKRPWRQQLSDPLHRCKRLPRGWSGNRPLPRIFVDRSSIALYAVVSEHLPHCDRFVVLPVFCCLGSLVVRTSFIWLISASPSRYTADNEASHRRLRTHQLLPQSIMWATDHAYAKHTDVGLQHTPMISRHIVPRWIIRVRVAIDLPNTNARHDQCTGCV